jgi:hypothetical protein
MHTAFFVIGIVLVFAAAAFGFYPGFEYRALGSAWIPNASPSGAACGLGIAGGLSFVAAAIAYRGPKKQE